LQALASIVGPVPAGAIQFNKGLINPASTSRYGETVYHSHLALSQSIPAVPASDLSIRGIV